MPEGGEPSALPFMPGYEDAMDRAPDYFCRVVTDVVAGSGLDAHEAALNAMEYLQTGARRTSEEIAAAFDALTVS